VLQGSLQYPQSSTNYISLKYGTYQIHKIIYGERTQMMGKQIDSINHFSTCNPQHKQNGTYFYEKKETWIIDVYIFRRAKI
jgi:hypothetical protein